MHSIQSTLLLAALGLAAVASRGSERSVAPFQGGNSYVIIFRQGPITLTEEDNTRRQKEIVAWATRHQLAGHNLDPRGLESDVRRPGVPATVEANGEWPIVALVFLEARSIDEAAAIAADHPAKNYNVSTEVRPFVRRKVPDAKPETGKSADDRASAT
jgi:hypothetical protein